MTRCVNGHENNDDQRFCGSCGAPLAVASTSLPAPSLPIGTPTSPPDESTDVSGGGSTAIATQPKRTKRMVWLVAGALVLGAGIVAVFLVMSGDDAEALTIKGTSLLIGEFGEGDVEGSWDDCQGTGGYDDFGAGQNVSVLDADGTLIGSGKTQSVDKTSLATIVEIDASTNGLGLESADPTDAEAELLEFLESMADLEAACMVYFEVEVPVSDFYTIEVGRRGELDYSLAEMQERNFHVSFSLGS